jgi:hypothetical protein
MKSSVGGFTAVLLTLVFLTSVSCVNPGASCESCAEDSSKSTSPAAAPGTPTWARYSPENAGLSLELPGELHPFNVPMPEDPGRGFKQVTAYTYNDRRLFVFLCHYVSHKPEVARESLKDLAAGFIDSLKKSAGLTDSSTEVSGPCRILMRGSYKQKNVPVRFEGFARRYEANAWILVATYAQSDSSGRPLAQQVLDSVRIN